MINQAPQVATRDALGTVQSMQSNLRRLAFVRAVLLGLCAAFVLLTVGHFVLQVQRGESGLRDNAAIVTLLAALTVAIVSGILLWRSGGVSLLRAALWIEERSPSGYALVALAEDSISGGALLSGAQRDGLARTALASRRVDTITQSVRTSMRRELLGPALFAASLLMLVIALWAPTQMIDGLARATARPGAENEAADEPIGRWEVRVIAPAYSGIRAQAAGDANNVRVLEGSRIELTGRGSNPTFETRVVADTSGGAVGSKALAQSNGNGWKALLEVDRGSLELRASRGGKSRLLLVDAYRDSIPHLSLEAPERDSVLRRATGSIPLEAILHDDIGLASASFELIVSTGEGERFTAKTEQLGSRSFDKTRDATIRAAINLDALKLAGGDVIHVRAVARDANPARGRESGSSETRSFRIARESEYDSVAVDPAPPPAVDSSLLSQRMLLMLTEKLEARRPKITRSVLLSESQHIARDQARLRQAVGDVVFQRIAGEEGGEHAHSADDGHEHGVDLVNGRLAMAGGMNEQGVLEEGDDSPVIAINRPLLEAYNAMWDAGRALEQGETRVAIPHMKLALAALERARTATRIYLRGKPPSVIVDIAKVRLAGKDTGSTNARSERRALPARDALREKRLLAAVEALARDATAARDSLAVLRLESVDDAPVFADALIAALDALRAGRDLTPALLRARKALGGVTRVEAGLWSRPVSRQ